MFADRIAVEISAATLPGLDQLSHAVWKAYAAGALDDAEAQRLAETIAARRSPARAAQKPIGLAPGRPSIFPPKRLQRSPDRARSIERRRTLAASGVMPPTLASRFTTGELAVLRIVADAARDNGWQCVLPIDAIAARAGVCRRRAQTAIRQAAQQGLLVVQERRRSGQRNASNVIRLVSREWLAWLARGRVQKVSPHGYELSKRRSNVKKPPPKQTAKRKSCYRPRGISCSSAPAESAPDPHERSIA